MDIGLYDSATGASLVAEASVDVSAHQTRSERAELVYTTAQRGRIVQLVSDGMRIHYFIDEDGGQDMMREDSERFGFAPGQLPVLALDHAPKST